MVRIVTFRDNNIDLANAAYSIRTEVFVKEKNVPHELEYDGSDAEAQHYLLYYNNLPVATARWRITTKGIKLERFAVLREYRNKGLGGEMVKKVLEDILKLSKPIYLHSQLAAVKFYERYGFEKEGELFTEAGLEHFRMVFRA